MMDFDRIRSGLIEKRTNLLTWLAAADQSELQTHTGPAGSSAVEANIDALEDAIQKSADGTLGLCTICDGTVEIGFLEADYTACVCLSHLPENEMRQLERELELAQVVQRSLLPQRLPAIPSLEIAAYSQPAQIVGGDYFDFLQFADGAHGLAIADVAGHGVSSSLHMASVQTALNTLVPISDSPLAVLQQINRLYNHNINFTSFVTLFLAKLGPDGELQYCNAGHNPPLHYRPTQSENDGINWLDPNGAAIGLVEDIRIKLGRTSLAPGDVLLLYTDGVTEAMDSHREQFGSERLAECIRRVADLPVGEMVHTLRQDIQEFTSGGPLADDTTILVCKVVG